MLDLGEGDKVEDLDEELTGDVGLVVGESLDGNKDGWGSDDKGVQGIKGGGREEGKPNWLRGQRGCVGRLVSVRGGEKWHSYGGGLDRR